MHRPQGRGGFARALRQALIVVAGLATLSVILAACGGSGSGSGSGSAGVASLGSTTSTAAPAAQGSPTQSKAQDAVLFSQCMRSHGVVDFPMPAVHGDHVNLVITAAVLHSSHYESALAHCRSLLPRGPGAPTITPADQADYLRGAACMRAHGFGNFPDPTITGNQVHFVVPANINQHSAQFEQAVQTCERLIPAGLPYSGS